MTQSPKSSRVTFIILRYMRRPIMVLIAIYATSMIGWILIPGVDAEGNPQNLSFFHAFYFLTYTVTTTGFGELPYTFTEAQRMWGIVSLYAGVIAWFYALGSIVGLVQNTEFQQSIAERRFAKGVARVTEPFCIICGFGNTGALLARGLSDAGMTVIVVDKNSERIKSLTLRDYRSPVSGLCADARVPEHLIEAGLLKPNCKAVVALTQDEGINLKVAVTARLLNPDVWMVTQSTSEVHEDTLATLGKNVHIIDPFQTYAKYLGAVIHNPAIHTLNQWLAGTPDATLDIQLRMPKGTWILCGFGRMGRWIRDSLEAQNISTVVIEPNPSQQDEGVSNLIVGRANQDNLLKAGVEEAAGIVAGTNNDSDNLSILLNARALNPNIFLLVRQNRYRNQLVFQATQADFIMMPSLVSARRILFLLLAPLLKTFFEALRGRDASSTELALSDVIDQLATTVGGSHPRLWTVDICASTASALLNTVEGGQEVALGDILRDPVDRNKHLACVPLVMRSGQELNVMPALTTVVQPGEQILFCGTASSLRLLDATLNNEYTLRYLISGIDQPRGYVMQWFTRRHASRASSA
jgi:Trk K+ transport system NAD-binding subunit